MSTPTPRTNKARQIDNGDTRPLLDEMETLERELAAERQKLRTAREALASIEEQWWANNDANMHACGNVMFTLAKNAHAATEDET